MDNWQALRDELDKWPQPVQFWWRDDDAIEDTQALQKLLTIAQRYSTAVHLAVIPQRLHPSLSIIKTPANQPYCYVLQHGIEHLSHALPEQRKIELGGSQDISVLAAQLGIGRQRLKAEFERQYLDILVPPWNRIAEQLVKQLPQIGYRKLSVLGVPKELDSAYQVNVHIDIINRKRRGFAGEATILGKLIEHLQFQRTSAYAQPCGLMTHHLDHDLQCWQFLDKFFSFCQGHSQIQWLSGEALYAN